MKTKARERTFDHSGSSFDSFLDEEGIREEVEAVAIKRVLAWQLESAMRKQQKTKQAMARELHIEFTIAEGLAKAVMPEEPPTDRRVLALIFQQAPQ